MSTLCLLGTGDMAVIRAEQNSPVLMCLEGNLDDGQELVRGEQVAKQDKGFQTEEWHVQRSRGKRL